MFCPSCGTADQKPNTYCRRCGAWLVDLESIQSKDIKKKEEQMKAMVFFNALSAVLALTSAILLYATYLDTPEIKWSVYVAGALCSIIAGHQTISFLFAREVTNRLRNRLRGYELEAGRGIETQAALLSSRATNEIPGQPNLTEDTTRKLEGAPIAKDSRVR